MQINGVGRVAFKEDKQTNSGEYYTTFQVSEARKQGDEYVYTSIKALAFKYNAQKMSNVADGDYVAFSGQLQEDKWEEGGVTKRMFKILIDRVDKLAPKEEQSSNVFSHQPQTNDNIDNHLPF